MIRGFIKGLTVGIFMGFAFVYLLSMTQIVAISIIRFPDIHKVLTWAYDNLRLSAIPFLLVFIFFIRDLLRLNTLLNDDTSPIEKIGQTDHLIDIWIKLFFGIGVIWTAIGMRSALLEGVGGLDAVTAAREGAFAILKRLVDGGILLALSTTIFGGIGGYLMHLAKTILLGKKLQTQYNLAVQRESDHINQILGSIADDVKRLVIKAERG